MDGGGNPWHSNAGDGSLMGYTIRDELWRYTAWVGFDWGEGGDPRGEATTPKWEEVSALELYDHRGALLTTASSDTLVCMLDS